MRRRGTESEERPAVGEGTPRASDSASSFGQLNVPLTKEGKLLTVEDNAPEGLLSIACERPRLSSGPAGCLCVYRPLFNLTPRESRKLVTRDEMPDALKRDFVHGGYR